MGEKVAKIFVSYLVQLVHKDSIIRVLSLTLCLLPWPLTWIGNLPTNNTFQKYSLFLSMQSMNASAYDFQFG
jgi:hypothetical protein